MAIFKCPVITCNVKHEGDIWNVTPMAIMHMKGSHQINLTDEDVSEIVSWEASPETMYKPWPKLYPEVKEKPPQKKVKDKDAVKSWWDKVNG